MSSDSIENQISYGIGRQMGDQLRGNNIPGIEAAAVCEGLCDALAGTPSRLSPEQLQAAFAALNDRLQEHQAREVKQQAAAGEQFLAQNRTRPEVTTLASGLQYEVIRTGEGAKPSATDTVSTHYHGTLIDGSVFDSSVERGVPAEFPVNRVIAGWTEALQLMSVGSKWRLFIPYQLAYGERGAGGAIAPFAALIFDVELLAIVK
ncbi:MAG: FKBP-type peptidyl-prolyl cis-trans isomerase [Moraxellaceae bacterium]|nr:MAG: FKBP-type peptidyl-prolyl cis-trans isomerase [Moraxellaceae bacterium]